MKITDEIIDYVSTLSRLELSTDEKETAKVEIGKILNYMDMLNTLDTDGIEAMSHAFPVSNAFREDELKPSVDKDLITANTESKKDGCFKVPKAVD
ncbi:MAG: Asp-tRNA(Asn)/Glu-tRNA(Gln) amidotransferase subunit GatC [Clostridia bacterium]